MEEGGAGLDSNRPAPLGPSHNTVVSPLGMPFRAFPASVERGPNGLQDFASVPGEGAGWQFQLRPLPPGDEGEGARTPGARIECRLNATVIHTVQHPFLLGGSGNQQRRG